MPMSEQRLRRLEQRTGLVWCPPFTIQKLAFGRRMVQIIGVVAEPGLADQSLIFPLIGPGAYNLDSR